MNQAWQQFLAAQQMQMSPEGFALYHQVQPQPDIREPGLLSLDCLAILRLRGEKAIAALQGQITQDAKLLANGTSLFTDICNPKGRIIASALLIPKSDDHILILMDSLQAERLCEHLNKYLMFHRVTIQPAQELVCLAHMNSTPSAPEQLTAVLSSRLTLELLSYEQAISLWQADPRAKGAANTWQTLLMMHGICWVGANLSETYTPHHLNHPALGFVNFKKGCYTGQEIIARMEYKAKLKTRFALLSGKTRPENETLLNAEGLPVGKLILSHEAASDHWLSFAELRSESVTDTAPVYNNDEILQPIKPPYAINN